MDHKLNIEDLQESLQTSFICKKHDSSEKYRSKFLISELLMRFDLKSQFIF